MKMKKTLAVLLVVSMMTSMAACGKNIEEKRTEITENGVKDSVVIAIGT